MSWLDTSRQIIKQAKIDNPSLSHQELREFLYRNYPFRYRKGYAYKSWLKAMREEFGSEQKITEQENLF